MRTDELARAACVLRGPDAARHLFRVAAALESMVVGEAKIQGQVRHAHELGLSLGAGGRIINRLFQHALRVGKRVRAETGIAGGAHPSPQPRWNLRARARRPPRASCACHRNR
jgi:glutamyl-tRNA reductase